MKKIIISEKLKPILDKNKNIDLSSFELKKYLNPKFFDNEVLKSRVRLRLLDIVDEFISNFKFKDLNIEDIVLTGSLANYNWSKYSDVDLHIILDFKKINKDVDLLREFFNSVKINWNNDHIDLKIYGFSVEIYIEDISDKTESNGIYSIEKNKWVKKPVYKNISYDKKNITNKSIKFINLIENILDKYENNFDQYKNEELLNEIEKLLRKINNMRRLGLKKDGEFSNDNITYKILRRTGSLDKLYDLKIKIYDKLNSL